MTCLRWPNVTKFKSTPHPFKQIFTIHAMYMNHPIHFVTCLLEGKHIEDYLFCLSTVKARIQQLTGIAWQPTKFICDFEQSIISAIEVEFPQATINGCYFHYTKSLRRKVGEFGLIHAYRTDQEFKGNIIRTIMALGFDILGTSPLANNRVRLSWNRTFFQLCAKYILPNSNFPPPRWNLWHRNMSTRTNNIVESFHSSLNSAIMVRHPSLWIFVRHLKDVHAQTNLKTRDANIGVALPRKRKWRRIEQNILRLKTQYLNGQRNLHNYWSNACYYIEEFVPRH